mgnify:CR=1 FL=1
MLPAQAFVPSVQFALPPVLTSAAARVPEPAGSCISPDVDDLVQEFVRNFFVYLDTRNPSLFTLYAADASLSISLASDASVNQANKLAVYTNVARNIVAQPFISPPNINNARTGVAAIRDLLGKLPTTYHEIDAFTIDAVPIPEAPVVTVRVSGEFLDTTNRLIRTFFRTFMLQVSAD